MYGGLKWAHGRVHNRKGNRENWAWVGCVSPVGEDGRGGVLRRWSVVFKTAAAACVL